MKQPDQAIFYSDGSIIECGADGDEEVEVVLTFKVWKKYLDAPVDGIQAIVQRDEYANRHVLRGQDYYYPLPKGMIHAGDNLAPWLNEHCKKLVKFGSCLDDDEYTKVMQRVIDYHGIDREGIRNPRPDENVG